MIKIIRTFYGIDQYMLALYLGVNRSSISMAEGLKSPQNERLCRLFLSIPRQDISRAALEQQIPDDGLQEAITQQIATNEERLYRKNCDARRLQIDQDIAALEARQSVLRQKLVELATAQQLP